MNLKAIDELIEWLEDGAPHQDAVGNIITLDMESWQRRTSCGTSACLAGATVQFNDPDFAEEMLKKHHYSDDDLYSPTLDRAQKILSISDEIAEQLFMPWVTQDENIYEFAQDWDVGPKGALAALRSLKETGIPSWSVPAQQEDQP